jgi:hypothetical protein
LINLLLGSISNDNLLRSIFNALSSFEIFTNGCPQGGFSCDGCVAGVAFADGLDGGFDYLCMVWVREELTRKVCEYTVKMND